MGWEDYGEPSGASFPRSRKWEYVIIWRDVRHPTAPRWPSVLTVAERLIVVGCLLSSDVTAFSSYDGLRLG